MKRLLTLETLEIENSAQVENKFIADHQKVAKELGPLVKFINFRRIKGQILTDIIEPLGIIIVLSAYRNIVRSNDLSINNIHFICGISQHMDQSLLLELCIHKMVVIHFKVLELK